MLDLKIINERLSLGRAGASATERGDIIPVRFDVSFSLSRANRRLRHVAPTSVQKPLYIKDYLLASSIATATATVIPTMGLLPAPMRPIIST